MSWWRLSRTSNTTSTSSCCVHSCSRDIPKNTVRQPTLHFMLPWKGMHCISHSPPINPTASRVDNSFVLKQCILRGGPHQTKGSTFSPKPQTSTSLKQQVLYRQRHIRLAISWYMTPEKITCRPGMMTSCRLRAPSGCDVSAFDPARSSPRMSLRACATGAAPPAPARTSRGHFQGSPWLIRTTKRRYA